MRARKNSRKNKAIYPSVLRYVCGSGTIQSDSEGTYFLSSRVFFYIAAFLNLASPVRVHGVYGYYVCSVSERVMCSVLAICRCIAPCARCQDLFNPKKHTGVQMLRDEFSKMWRGNSLEARKKARKKKHKFSIFSKLGWIGMCFCLNSLL